MSLGLQYINDFEQFALSAIHLGKPGAEAVVAFVVVLHLFQI
jgi:hypothetical protein